MHSCRTVHHALVAILLLPFFLAAANAQKPPPKAPSKPATPAAPTLNLAQISQEVQALIALGDLDLDAEQLQRLAKLAAGAASEDTPEPPKVSEAVQKALKDLHAALVKGDEEKGADLRFKFEELKDKDNPDFNDDFEVTDAAKKKVGAVLKLLNVRQLGGYISGLDLKEPHELLLEAFEEIRAKKGEEREKQIQQVSDEVTQMIAGENNPQAKKTKEQVKKLLDQVAEMKDDDYEKKFPELEKRAKAIVGTADCVQVLRHLMEREMAKLLSNPQLAHAIEIRTKILEKQQPPPR